MTRSRSGAMGQKKRRHRTTRPPSQVAREPAGSTVTETQPPVPVLARSLVYPSVLAVLVLVAYANSFRVPFLLDDEVHIVNEATIRSPLSLSRMLAMPRPAVTASLALNHAIGGLDPRGYHVFNLLTHLACGLLLYGLVRHTLGRQALRARFGRQADHLAGVTTALFLLHPIQTESVTYVIQRSEVFAAIALLGAVWAAAIASDAPRPGRYLTIIGVVGVFGLLAKQSIVVLPLLFALYDWCFIAEGRIERMGRHWRIYLVLLVVALATASRGGVVEVATSGLGETAGFHMKGISSWRYLTWEFGVLLYYLRIVVVPDRLCFDCGYFGPWPVLHSALGDGVWLPFGLLASGLVAAAVGWRRQPLITYAILGSAIVLIPTSSVVPLADAYVEHRLYLPIGLLAMGGVAAAFGMGEAVIRRRWLPAPFIRGTMVAAAVVVSIGLCGLTIARNELYGDPLRLWQDSVAKAPENDRAHAFLAREYERRGQRELAARHYREAVLRNAYFRVGARYLEQGRHADAIEIFEWVRVRRPSWAIVHQYLATAYRSAGRTGEAVVEAERAVALSPASFTAHKMLADLYAEVGRRADALHEYQAAGEINPSNSEVRQRITILGGSGEQR